VTKKEIRDRVVATIGLQAETPLDESGLVDHWVYRGTLDLLSRTRCTARCVQLGVSAGVDTYALAAGILSLIDVDDGDMPRVRRDDETTRPGFTLIRSDLLQIHPAPSEDGKLQVWAVLRPAQMGSDTDDLSSEAFGAIPIEFQDAIELYALWWAADYGHEAQTQRGERYRVLYEGQDGRGGRLAEVRKLVNKRGTARPPWTRKVTRGRRQTHRLAWVD